jgi:hypothetical protein
MFLVWSTKDTARCLTAGLRFDISVDFCNCLCKIRSMFLVPYRRQTLKAAVPAEKLKERVRNYLAAGAFKGAASAEGFRFRCGGWRRDTYQPWLIGHIRPVGSVSELEVVYTLRPLAIALMAVLTILALWQLLVRHSWTGLVFVGIAHCVFYLVSFLPLVRKSEDILCTMTEH